MSDHKLSPIGTRRPRPPRGRQFSLYLSRDLLVRLETWRASQSVPPTRAAAIRHILTDFLDQYDQQEST
jgi:hypothetical protein